MLTFIKYILIIVLVPVVILICSIILILLTGFITEIISNKISNKIMKSNKSLDPKDKEQLEYFINKDYLEIISKNKENYKIEDDDYWYLEDIVADIDDICRTILMSQKKLYHTKEEVLEKEFIDMVKKLNNKEINDIYKEMQKVKKIAFKYYDEEGNIIIKK